LAKSKTSEFQLWRVPAVQESDTYLAILEEGELKHARKTVMRFGLQRCGAPSEEVTSRLESIIDLERLDRMLLCALDAGNWDEILETP
jgi:hypothetical protein